MINYNDCLAATDRILGTEAGTGIIQEMLPEDAAALIGAGGGSSGWPTTLSGSASTSESAGQFLSIRGQGGQASNGADIYQSSAGKFEWVCVVANVRNDCNYIRKLAASKYFEIQNSSGTSIFRVTENTGAITNMTLDAEGSGNTITRPFYWDLDLCGINPTDSSLAHIWNKDPLSTAPTLTAKSGTNRSTCVATFPDSDGDYGVAITRRLPTGFTGNFDAEIWWDTTGTGNAVFQVSTKCYASNDADDASYNSATSVAAGAGTSGRPNAASNPDITKTGCSGGNLMRIRFFRNRTNGSDTLNAALNVEKVIFRGRATN